MKKSFCIILSLLPLVFSCNVFTTEEGACVPESLTAGAESFETTKTSLSTDRRILWGSGDQIIVWSYNTSGARYQVAASSVGEGLGNFSIVPPVPSAGSRLGAVVAFYPYSGGLSCSASGSSYLVRGVNLPATQTYVADSFGPGALPMVTVTTGDELVFSIVCGVLKLQLTGTATISSIEVKGNRSETLCGSATVTASDGAAPSITMTGSGKTVTLDCGSGVPLNGTTPTVFDIVLPPLTMAGGFTVTVNSTDGRTMTLVSQKSQTIKRAGILRMPEREFTTNGGVVNLSRGLAAEWGKYGITVNTVCPGYFYTPLTQDTLDSEFFQDYAHRVIPLERYGNEGELDTTVLFLSSPASAYVTGVALPVDGGYTCV